MSVDSASSPTPQPSGGSPKPPPWLILLAAGVVGVASGVLAHDVSVGIEAAALVLAVLKPASSA
jgi:hypothetical protein